MNRNASTCQKCSKMSKNTLNMGNWDMILNLELFRLGVKISTWMWGWASSSPVVKIASSVLDRNAKSKVIKNG